MLERIINFKDKLSVFKTEEILGYISNKLITFSNSERDFSMDSNIFKKTKLDSPYRQYLYLAGLLMSTEYREASLLDEEEPIESNEERDVYENTSETEENNKFDEIEREIKEITDRYLNFFIPDDLSIEDLQSLSDLEKRKRMVTMQTFTTYFSSDILRYDEQIIARMKLFGLPFDEILYKEKGIRVSDLIAFYNFITSSFKLSISRFSNSIRRIEEFRQVMIRKTKKNNEDNKNYDYMLRYSNKLNKSESNNIENLYLVHSESIVKRFGIDKTLNLLSLFSLERSSRDFAYYNSFNPFTGRPLCKIDEGRYFIVHPRIILTSLYDYLIETLVALDGQKKIKYYDKRGDITEGIALELFKDIFGSSATYYTSVCEKSKTDEHDLLIVYKDKLLIVEIKSSKVKEPMFNPDKSYTRIKDHFNSKVGIGGGYKQAQKLKEFILSTDKVTLYYDMSKEFELKRNDFNNIYLIVITLEQFGPANINMSQLLEKDKDAKYPWSCNLYDFENLVEMLRYLRKTPDEFLDYIEWRIKKHEKIISSDELEIFEVYFGNEEVKEVEDIIYIPTLDYSLVDKIYFEKHGISYYHPNYKVTIKDKIQKVGRNDPCPCGSGKKYKKCCL